MAGRSDAPIPWPFRKGQGRPSCILCGDLIRAVKTESEIAVAHHWGVDKKTVWAWRKALDVPRMTKGGTQLAIDYVPERLTDEARAVQKVVMDQPEVRAKIRASKVGKPLHPNLVAAQREAVKKPKSKAWKKKASARMSAIWAHPEEHGLSACHHWTEEQIALLGTDTDGAIAERLGIPPFKVENKRRQLGIPGFQEPWRPAEIALLGTMTDRRAAWLIARTTQAVRTKREKLGITPFVARWTDEEIALLGTDTDRAVVKKLGRTSYAVVSKRADLGIPAYQTSR